MGLYFGDRRRNYCYVFVIKTDTNVAKLYLSGPNVEENAGNFQNYLSNLLNIGIKSYTIAAPSTTINNSKRESPD